MVVGTAVMGKAPTRRKATRSPASSPTSRKRSSTPSSVRPTRTQLPPRSCEAPPRASSTTSIAFGARSRPTPTTRRNGSPPAPPRSPARPIDSRPLPPQGLKIQLSFSYSDGFGREIQKKIQAEPGPVVDAGPVVNPRWVGSGWTIFNNKGKPVRQYEPFFTRHAPLRVRRAGRRQPGPVLRPGRARRRHAAPEPHLREGRLRPLAAGPPGTSTTPCCIATPSGRSKATGDFFAPPADIGGYLPILARRSRQPADLARADASAAPLGPHERDAALQAARPRRHADRRALRLARPHLPDRRHNNASSAATTTCDGPPKRVRAPASCSTSKATSARCRRTRLPSTTADGQSARIVMRYDYDMLGNRIHQASMEAGERWMLNDVAGKPIRAWDSRGHGFRTTYDALRRPVEQTVRGTTRGFRPAHAEPRDPGRQDRLRREPAQPRSAQPAHPHLPALRLRRRRHQRQARRQRQPIEPTTSRATCCAARAGWCSDYTAIPDWLLPAAPQLDAETFTSSTRYDALNRPIQLIAPHSDRPGRDKSTSSGPPTTRPTCWSGWTSG